MTKFITPKPKNGGAMCQGVDTVFDDLLAKLRCADGSDAELITHWQDGNRPGFRIQVTRKSDGASRTRFVGADGAISL